MTVCQSHFESVCFQHIGFALKQVVKSNPVAVVFLQNPVVCILFTTSPLSSLSQLPLDNSYEQTLALASFFLKLPCSTAVSYPSVNQTHLFKNFMCFYLLFPAYLSLLRVQISCFGLPLNNRSSIQQILILERIFRLFLKDIVNIQNGILLMN